MYEYFAAHAGFHRAKALAYPAFRDRFFVDGYEPFNPYEMVHSCQAERITAIEQGDSGATVRTSTVFHSLELQFRYDLVKRNGGWAVAKLEQFCMVCRGKGTWEHQLQCTRCKGTGWEVMAA